MNKTTKIILIVCGVILILGSIIFLLRDQLTQRFFKPTVSNVPAGIANGASSEVTTTLQNLQTPWEIAFLPDGQGTLISERPGTLKRLGDDNQTYTIGGVEETTEGGLLGVAVHPDFADNRYIYLYYTTNKTGTLTNLIERYALKNDQLTDAKVIMQNIPAAANHDGGRLAFGPDGYLYITTGDAANTSLPQNTDSLAGKILRVKDDGTIPDDNPFRNAVYSYGHRNPQGLAWDDKGQLWATEHGPSGSPTTGCDELNLIKKGANYGWPIVMCEQTAEGIVSPVVQSGRDEVWAPAGMAFADGSLYFAGLRGQSLYRAQLQDNNSATLTANFREVYGRLRAVVNNGNALLVSTSNTDGRGDPKPQDDKILQIPLSLFQ